MGAHMMIISRALGVALLVLAAAPALAKMSDPLVARRDAGALAISWNSDGPVDVFMADRADVPLKSATLISAKDSDGKHIFDERGGGRTYFILRDVRSGLVTRVAERLLALERGSNFRDVGGYATKDGKHVRWGMIYRSGATPLLSAGDASKVASLGLKQMVDLRSSEERALAPSRIQNVPYAAVGYSMGALSPSGSAVRNGADLYRAFPSLLAPQLRIIFASLLSRQGPIAYNCSAGQDRTGFATAMILSALGVPRETIVEDYHLSTQYRRPEFEMPIINAAAHPDNPAAQMFAKYQQYPSWRTPTPLKEADGKPFLTGAFAEIETKWGSVDAYLEKEIGVSAADRKRLRQLYLQ
jgi:protein-tyrosine phosphatase